jgi:hypothetical protein
MDRELLLEEIQIHRAQNETKSTNIPQTLTKPETAAIVSDT